MAQVPLDNLVQYCAVELPGAPIPLIVNALNDAAIRLCKESQCWNQWVSIPLVADQSEYTLTPPVSFSTAYTIRKMIMDQREIIPLPIDTLIQNYTAFLLSSSGTPTNYAFTSANKVVFRPTPTVSDAGKIVMARVVWTPTLLAKTFDEELMDRYSEALIVGAKAKLMIQPEQPWSNQQLAMFYLNQQKEEIGKAKIEQMHDLTTGSLTVNRRVFGGVVIK